VASYHGAANDGFYGGGTNENRLLHTHHAPRYRKAISKYSDTISTEEKLRRNRPSMIDPDNRVRVLEKFGDMAQVLSISIPPLPEVVGPAEAIELARIANDELANG